MSRADHFVRAWENLCDFMRDCNEGVMTTPMFMQAVNYLIASKA